MARVLIIGSGAREHALAWRLLRDEEVTEVICAPGNGGTSSFATNRPCDLSSEAIVSLAQAEDPDLTVIGPEAPLVAGAADALRAAGRVVFGPDRAAARLEGSKAFSKEFMARHDIPTASFRVFDEADAAIAYCRSEDRPLVVKADGLAAGKGVVVAADADEAEAAVRRIMVDRAFGDAGDRVMIEERLAGQEVSYHVVADGNDFVRLSPAQDHKRAFDGDRGPNTGGMGAYSPPPVVTPEVEEAIIESTVRPTLKGMSAEGCPFAGALFIGFMVDAGIPRVLEYNVRFGDPECQTIALRLGGSLFALLDGAARGTLAGHEPHWAAPAAMAVVLASRGYPGPYEKGEKITGLGDANAVEGVTVFHAGTKVVDGTYRTSGGRVLSVTAAGETIDIAAERAYQAADRIRFEGKQYRRDIGHHARR
ncbi:MAG: phosphoribosylamine--glycine ligase [Myxococcota bacterium]